MSEDLAVIEVRVSKAWIRFIRYCQVELPHGEIRVRIVNGQPYDLLDYKRKLNFSREETIPISFVDDGLDK